ncbi:uncharacterized protein LOC125052674 [Pieris napi]|uniref:uncharacterized protein LOC125052674 n=1 Tax=Pieris napi TaxID=78633 RepID=UPI001FB9AC63|nr:uncharacterized protein LOC125052674 [Pieris napi]
MVFVYIFLLSYFCKQCSSLLCFNCTSMHRDAPGCAGDFTKPSFEFNSTRNIITNCTGDETMCFVRSWTARSRHAWIVQRGCYQIQKGDLLPRTMNIPMRSMSCKYERFPEADYKVCFCQADWCNFGTSIYKFSNTFGSVIFIFFCTYNLLKLYFYNLPVTLI